MNLGSMVAGIILANLIAPAYALSLKLSPEVDLLVVDGRQVSGPILKGADSLELDAGQHQILFQITKNLPASVETSNVYHSPPIIVAFNAKSLHSVSISLPALTSAQEGRDFSKNMNIALIDEKGNKVDYRQDRLSGINIKSVQNFEAAMTQYNLSGQTASVPAFALTEKSSMTLNAKNVDPTTLSQMERSTVQQAFSLWSLLQHNPRSSSDAGHWFSAQ
ncbi:hypothetical protein ASE93_11225 [Serratia sp. Leaf50]|nr:hypothetical protein ASE93_11225 [Serratia sp. Leaf50]